MPRRHQSRSDHGLPFPPLPKFYVFPLKYEGPFSSEAILLTSQATARAPAGFGFLRPTFTEISYFFPSPLSAHPGLDRRDLTFHPLCGSEARPRFFVRFLKARLPPLPRSERSPCRFRLSRFSHRSAYSGHGRLMTFFFPTTDPLLDGHCPSSDFGDWSMRILLFPPRL